MKMQRLLWFRKKDGNKVIRLSKTEFFAGWNSKSFIGSSSFYTFVSISKDLPLGYEYVSIDCLSSNRIVVKKGTRYS